MSKLKLQVTRKLCMSFHNMTAHSVSSGDSIHQICTEHVAKQCQYNAFGGKNPQQTSLCIHNHKKLPFLHEFKVNNDYFILFTYQSQCNIESQPVIFYLALIQASLNTPIRNLSSPPHLNWMMIIVQRSLPGSYLLEYESQQ